MTEAQTRHSSDQPVPVARPSVSRNPRVAVPIIVALHGPLDLLTAYWMMSIHGPGVEWNPITAAMFTHGPLAYAAFVMVGTAVLGAMLWGWRESLWSNRWTPAVAEILIVIGAFGLVGANVLAALGIGI